MKYTTLDKNNIPNAFYDDTIHGALQIRDPLFKPGKGQTLVDAPLVANPDTTIPASAVSIPDAVWQASIDGTKHVYDSVTKTWSVYVFTPAEKLLTAQQAKLATIEADYQKLLDAGVTYSGALFQANAHSIATLTETLAAVANGWPLPAAFAWIDSANKAHPANLAFLKGLSVAMANHKSALFSRLYAAKASINKATTRKAVKAVVL